MERKRFYFRDDYKTTTGQLVPALAIAGDATSVGPILAHVVFWEPDTGCSYSATERFDPAEWRDLAELVDRAEDSPVAVILPRRIVEESILTNAFTPLTVEDEQVARDAFRDALGVEQ